MNSLLNNSISRSINANISKILINKGIQDRPKTSLQYHKPSKPPTESLKSSDEIARQIFRKKCEDLDIAINPIAEQKFISKFLSAFQEKVTNLSGLGFGPKSMFFAISYISKCTNLIYLDLSSNKIGDQGALAVAKYIKSDPNIIFLDLRSNLIGAVGSAAVFSSISSNTHLVSLDMSASNGADRNRIGSQGSEALANALISNQTFSYLNAAMLGVSADTCQQLSRALAQAPSFTELNISINEIGSVGLSKLCSYSGSLSSLHSLLLSNDEIGDLPCKPFFKQLSLTKTLRKLDLSQNGLGEKFLKRLVKSMRIGTSLHSLKLSHNKINAKCTNFIVTILSQFPSLKKVDISSNLMHDGAISQILRSLFENNHITVFDFSNTGITNECAPTIRDLIEQNSVIQRLAFNDNRIGDVSIPKALAKNYSLNYLSMRSNEFDDNTSDSFIESLNENKILVSMDISLNGFSYRNFSEISKVLEERKKAMARDSKGLAARKIGELRAEEAKLCGYKSQIEEKQKSISELCNQRDTLNRIMNETNTKLQQENKEAEAELERLKKRYIEVTEERRQQISRLNKIKEESERKEAAAREKNQSSQTYASNAQSRLARAQDKMDEARFMTDTVISDLRTHLETVKEKLEISINQAIIMRQGIFAEEERKRRAEIEMLPLEGIGRSGQIGTSRASSRRSQQRLKSSRLE